jgi:hypothetical protein
MSRAEPTPFNGDGVRTDASPSERYGARPVEYHWRVCEIRQKAHDEYFRKCLNRQQQNFLFTPACAGSNTYYLDNHGDSPFRPSTHGEMYWHNRHYDLDVYHYSAVATVPGGIGAETKEHV